MEKEEFVWTSNKKGILTAPFSCLWLHHLMGSIGTTFPRLSNQTSKIKIGKNNILGWMSKPTLPFQSYLPQLSHRAWAFSLQRALSIWYRALKVALDFVVVIFSAFFKKKCKWHNNFVLTKLWLYTLRFWKKYLCRGTSINDVRRFLEIFDLPTYLPTLKSEVINGRSLVKKTSSEIINSELVILTT